MGNNQTSSFDPLVNGHLCGLFEISSSIKHNDAALQQRASAALEQNVSDWISVINGAMPGVGTMIGDSIRASVQHEISIAFAMLHCRCSDSTRCQCENAELMRDSVSAMQTTQESIVSGLNKIVGKESMWRSLLTNQLIGIIDYFHALSKNSNELQEMQRRCFLQGNELSAALTSCILG